MAASDPSSDLISEYLSLLRRTPAMPDVAASPLSTAMPVRDAARPCALILSPHPDDECLAGALPLRLMREEKWQIINLAVTLGSKTDRRAARKNELAKACAVLGFDCLLPEADGFEVVTQATRTDAPQSWRKTVERVAAIIKQIRPQMILMPHAGDAHPTHIGAHLLGMDALAAAPPDVTCAVVQSEYWQPMEAPNLMIGVGEKDAGVLLAALACHAGENARNPFDARFPAYLIDNVRRGSERVGGKGVASAAMDFAMLYGFGIWKNGKFTPSALNRIVGPNEALGNLLDI
jgi:LmbE family N-acetylglucosaminyl deacetylase